jgi:hypothetical protein
MAYRLLDLVLRKKFILQVVAEIAVDLPNSSPYYVKRFIGRSFQQHIHIKYRNRNKGRMKILRNECPRSAVKGKG